MSPGDLAELLGTLPNVTDPAVLVGFDTSDDGAVYRLTEDTAVVQSLDVLTPVVDDPYDFGRIAASNSLSDIYAMGAEPRFALSFAGFPRSVLPMSVLRAITAGASAIAKEAGIPIIGGHTIDDPEPKFGLAVTGIVHPERVVRNSAGRPGDQLVLTKPLGSGVLTTANKRGALSKESLAEIVTSMATLNAAAARAMSAVGAVCATDVTGFGLLGHLHEMAAGSNLGARLSVGAVPVFTEARRLAEAGFFPGGSRRNLSYLEGNIDSGDSTSEVDRLILADAQTSGGLLIAIAPERVDALFGALQTHGVAGSAVIGSLCTEHPGRIVLDR